MLTETDNKSRRAALATPRARYEVPRLIALGRVTDLTQANSNVKNVGPPDGQNPAKPV